MQKNKQKLPGLLIPVAYLEALQGKITPNEFVLLTNLAVHADFNSGECWPSLSTLAKLSNCSRRTAQRCIHKLILAGFVRVLELGTGRKATRYLLPHVAELAALRASKAKEGEVKVAKEKAPHKEQHGFGHVENPIDLTAPLMINGIERKPVDMIEALITRKVRSGQCKSEASFRNILTRRARRGIIYKNKMILGECESHDACDVTEAIEATFRLRSRGSN